MQLAGKQIALCISFLALGIFTGRLSRNIPDQSEGLIAPRTLPTSTSEQTARLPANRLSIESNQKNTNTAILNERDSIIAQREQSAPIDAKRLTEKRRDEYWAKLQPLGMSIVDFDQFMDNVAQTLSLSFIAEQTIVDQVSSQRRAVKQLEKTLTKDAFSAFQKYELEGPARVRLQELKSFAETHGVEIDSDSAAAVEAALLKSGILPKAFGGPFDPVIIPGVGLDTAESERIKALPGLEAAYQKMLSQLKGTVPDAVYEVLKSDFESQIVQQKTPIPSAEEMEARVEAQARRQTELQDQTGAGRFPPKP